MSIQFNYKKLLINLFKYLLGLALIAGLAWGGYELFMSWSNIPFNVRVTNITARSATVSWLTDRPSKGSVAYSDSEEMGILNYQALTAYDDRDEEVALSEVLSSIDTSEDEVSFPDISDIQVKKQREFYVHHVTITDLEPEEEYFFSIKNGMRFWTEETVGIDINRNSQGVINELDFKTTAALVSVPAPSPAYGKVISLGEDENGDLIERDSLDAVIFYRVEDMSDVDGRESGLLSSVTNETGGWYIDRANLRYADNDPFDLNLENDMAYIFSNVENIRKGYDYMLITGLEDAPAPDVLGNGVEEEEVSALSEILISLESVVSAGNPPDGCNTDVCYNGAYWKEIGGQCRKGRTCKATKPGEGAGDTARYVGDDGGVTVKPGGCYPGALGYGTKYSNGADMTCEGGAGMVYRDEDCNLSCTPGGGSSDTGDNASDSGDVTSSSIICCEIRGDAKTRMTALECAGILNTSVKPLSDCGGGVNSSHGCFALKAEREAEGNPCFAYSCESSGASSYELVEYSTGTEGCAGAASDSVDTATGGDSDDGLETCPSYSPSPGKKVADLRDCCPAGYVCSSSGDWEFNQQCEDGWYASPYFALIGNKTSCKKWGGESADTSDDKGVVSEKATEVCCVRYKYGSASTVEASLNAPEGICSSREEVEDWLNRSHSGYTVYSATEGYCSSAQAPGKLLADATVLGVSTASAVISEEGAVVFPESGIYEVNIEGDTFNVVAFEGETNAFYNDVNNIPGYQEAEDTKIRLTGVTLDVEKKVGAQKLELKEGINLISFPYLPVSVDESSLTASGLLSLANIHDNNISSISFFESGKWQSGIAVEAGVANGERGRNFDLLPGRGYLVIATRDFVVDIPAKELREGVPISVSAGWNLTGINGFTAVYTARTLIESISSIDGLTADNVTWWPTSKGRYEGFQVSEATEYGFDYPISNDLGYFIRISDFSPESPSIKSIIWGPGTDLHGLPGSN